MAGRTLKLEICAPGQDLVELDVTDVIVPGEDGVFTVYPGHTALLSTLIPGVLVARDTSDREHLFAVHGGFAEVKDGAVIILADTFESQDDIDTSRAEAAEERARELLRKPPEDIDWTRAEAALARAAARIRATSHHGYH